ncbi:hypothetical protein NSE01_15250 [Novosphingobium sediminis]|uniref:Bacteriophage phiJL001 Gp84 C-terminal domain-containing protein n=1 Tax=Novosphingobium sediminis TaxID=707214 RepID=A0A512AJ67_9SPHN|nr:DUF2163 domain-containing protein [Novosphingobium sediminis]GEN99692.1 hypothetical protein NSE01_15250 [Novosphingobium sediminis]
MPESTRVWFSQTLETVAIWWRLERRDGVTLGFTSHDRDLSFDGLLHRTAPGMVPSAIRRTADFEADSAEVAGALSHDSIREEDLAAGRFDGGSIAMGLVDWETLERMTLYAGTIGAVGHEGAGFSAELRSVKDLLSRQIVPRTAPTCRAEFCAGGCTLSAHAFTHQATLAAISADGGAVRVTGGPAIGLLAFGTLRWIDGPEAGLVRRIEAIEGPWLMLDRTTAAGVSAGTRIELREGCDHTLGTCAARFGNAINFQGEPFLPGNDLLTRYPAAQR